jgi:hypothetical protein
MLLMIVIHLSSTDRFSVVSPLRIPISFVTVALALRLEYTDCGLTAHMKHTLLHASL